MDMGVDMDDLLIINGLNELMNGDLLCFQQCNSLLGFGTNTSFSIVIGQTNANIWAMFQTCRAILRNQMVCFYTSSSY